MGLHRYDAPTVLAIGEQVCLSRGQDPSARNIARHLGVSPRTVVRWRGGQASVRGLTADAVERVSGVPVNLMERERAA